MSQANSDSSASETVTESSPVGNPPNTYSGQLLESFIYGLAQTAAVHGTEIVPTAIAAFLEENVQAVTPQVAEALSEWRMRALKEKADRENEVLVQKERIVRLRRFVGQGLDQAWQARKLIQENPDHPMKALTSTTFNLTTSLEAADEILEK
ncbi:hypothetical protein HY346_02415 [Candidatus Microgenomates bacterium]|nr:hypothetical protein [Candidatus Microgenomates bacterium]